MPQPNILLLMQCSKMRVIGRTPEMEFLRIPIQYKLPHYLTNCVCEYCWPERGIQSSEWILKSSLNVNQTLVWDSHSKEWIQAPAELHALSVKCETWKIGSIHTHCESPMCCCECAQSVCTLVRGWMLCLCAQIMREICATQTLWKLHIIVCAQIVAARSHPVDGANSNLLLYASHATLPLKP